MQTPNYNRTKFACYSAQFTAASVSSLPPLLFVTFYENYDISWTLLGTLVLINFLTQLSIDLLFSAFSKYFNVKVMIKTMPLIVTAGMLLYALTPFLFKGYEFWGFAFATIIFSVAAGLGEVLLSPTVAAIPSKNPQRDMSFLHSLYGIGVFTVVLVSSVFFKLFGADNWLFLGIFFAVLPMFSAVLFMLSPIPDMTAKEEIKSVEKTKKKTVGIALCVLCIFFGACAEVTMTTWISGFMETELHTDKALGDILGLAGFAILLGATRFLYAKWGKNIGKTLLIGMVGALVCYLIVGLCPYAVPAFIACILTGVFTAMLWPGTLILMEENLSGVGVAAYALMAAGGDLGASLAPQLVGVVADYSGMQAGMLVSAIFPALGVVVLLVALRFFKKEKSLKDKISG